MGKQLSDLTALAGANTATDDLMLVRDVSVGQDKKMTYAEVILGLLARMTAQSINTLRLSVVDSTDLHNGTTCPQGTWVDVRANQNFTVASTDSIIAISIRGCAHLGSPSANVVSNSRIVVDSAGTPINRMLGGVNSGGGNLYGNPLAGADTVYLTGLSAGVHTLKTQFIAVNAAGALYLRITSNPLEECFATEVLEMQR